MIMDLPSPFTRLPYLRPFTKFYNPCTLVVGTESSKTHQQI